jgi:hypothetical protein
MLTISSDSHDDNALFCLPLVFVRVPTISDFGRPLFGILGRRCSYSGLNPSASNCQLHSVGGSCGQTFNTNGQTFPVKKIEKPFHAAYGLSGGFVAQSRQ